MDSDVVIAIPSGNKMWENPPFSSIVFLLKPPFLGDFLASHRKISYLEREPHFFNWQRQKFNPPKFKLNPLGS
jgi:hypothetical protein